MFSSPYYGASFKTCLLFSKRIALKGPVLIPCCPRRCPLADSFWVDKLSTKHPMNEVSPKGVVSRSVGSKVKSLKA